MCDEEKWDLSLMKRSALPDISSRLIGEGCITLTNDSTTSAITPWAKSEMLMGQFR
jgi:hypothetical protein